MDIKHILVATDLTDGSDRALDRALGLAHGCTVTLLHVLAAGLPDVLRLRLQTEIEAFLAEKARQSQASLRTGDIRTLVVTGDPFSTIIHEGIMRRADLLVVGEPAKLRRQDLFVGTTAECVARFADRPVLMVKQARHAGYGRVLVAFDGSEAAVRALEIALALNPDAEFRITYAWWRPPATLGMDDVDPQGIRNEKERIKDRIEHAVSNAATVSASRPTNLAIDLIESNPYLAIRHNVDWAELLVLGKHSKGGMAISSEIGRLARQMLAEAPCDVLVSPP